MYLKVMENIIFSTQEVASRELGLRSLNSRLVNPVELTILQVQKFAASAKEYACP